MSEATIEVQRREKVGKGANRRLRVAGQIPAVLYGADKDPVAIQVPRRLLLELFKAGGHENRIFLLKLSGTDQTRHAMIRDLQVDPTTSQVTHLDFQRINMDAKLRVKVRLELDGIPYGVKTEMGILDFVTREVEIECLPGNIPAHLPLDVSELAIGEMLRIASLPPMEGVTVVDDPEKVLVHVAHPTQEKEPEVAAAEAAAEPTEPEVLKKGKVVTDEEAAEAEKSEKPERAEKKEKKEK
jgi:large subunit ribosomal protein L25